MIPAILSLFLLNACPTVEPIEFRVSTIEPIPLSSESPKQVVYVLRGSEDFESPRRFELILYPGDFQGIEVGTRVWVVIERAR